MKKTHHLTHLTLLALFTGFIFPHGLSASSNEDEEKTIAKKAGRETARLVGQGKDKAEDFKEGWKKQLKKDKEERKKKKTIGKK